MRIAAVSLGLVLVIASTSYSQIVPPAPGVEIPDEVKQSVAEKGPGAFNFERAWIHKAEVARALRERFIEQHGFYQRDMMPASERPDYAITGTFAVPVFAVKYSDTGADPYPISTLQTRLFTGPHAPRTLTQFYDEISYGDLTLTGTVYGWTLLPSNNAFYTGLGACNGLCPTANMDNLIISTIGANDGAIDFSAYDNDGPDGIPDSGDDDGFVDFAAFVHPEQGAECGVNGNIWSHRFSLSGWGVAPYTTNDPRTGGGFIRVDDYVVQPAYNCGGATVIDIGVYCHEFGHAFGLPDLYDTNGGSEGVGHWCLMSSGNWNTPTNPAHMSAWTKDQLGWADITVVDNPPANYNIPNVENNRDVYRLDVMHERWRRTTDCPISGARSMKCGLLAAEATARNWASGAGYGNGWDETLSRDFEYNGSGTVTLQYQFSYNLEPTYDFVYGQITVGSTTSTFVTYDNIAAGNANINLTPYLSGAGPYRISFRMTSDQAFSDEDGSWATPCAAILLDNISVTGGGETYSTGFETREDGWAPDLTRPNEHFLVENRQPLGSDVNVWGGGGLAIWHIDYAVSQTGQGGNTGGSTNLRPRGVALEQADGLGNLEAGTNRGDGGDPWPGSGNKTLFNDGTVPNSKGYNATSSTATVQLLTGNVDPIVATMTGGWAAPGVASVTPNTGVSGNIVQVVIGGSGFAKGGAAELVGGITIPAQSVYWAGKDQVVADFDLTGAPNGDYDVVVYNPYNSSGALLASFEVTGGATGVDDTPKRFALRPNYPNPFNPSTSIRFDVASRSDVTLRVYDVSGAVVRTLVNEAVDAGSHVVEWNGRNDQGNLASSGVYFYRLTAPGFSDVRKMTLVK